MQALFEGVYSGRKVLITGHMGFKGSWLALWLQKMGATVIGYSDTTPSAPNHFDLLELDIISIEGDIRDQEKFEQILERHKPEIVFHLAAQALVKKSYDNPVETFETNVMGTLKVLEAIRHSTSVRAIINITSDKCYENREWVWGYRENDAMGGYDPYSASKGCSELVTSSYRNSFFNLSDYGNSHNILLSSCRSGNVIGGGDWADDRLIPDIMRATSHNKKVFIRYPHATRPWQHVLEPLSGYLLLGQHLLQKRSEFAESWNFGPSYDHSISVHDVITQMKIHWNNIEFEIDADRNYPHEASSLKLDCSKALTQLHWHPVWTDTMAFKLTAEWYKTYYTESKILSLEQLEHYIHDAKSQKLPWSLS